MYYDLLARIKNAEQAGKEFLHAPFSRMDFAIAKVLCAEGYLAEAEKRTAGKKSVLDIKLRYERNGRPALSGFRLVSKPRRRIYAGYRDVRWVKQGKGLAVLSTPLGIMSDKQSRKKKVGGEYLFQIW